MKKRWVYRVMKSKVIKIYLDPADDIDLIEDWDKQMALNLFTALNTIMAFMPIFKSAGFG